MNMEVVVKTASEAIDASKDKIATWLQGIIGDVLRGILIGIIDNSYWICLFVCLISLMCYLCGQRKAAKYSTLSVVVYFVLRAIKEVL
jgi:hypothetical protein